MAAPRRTRRRTRGSSQEVAGPPGKYYTDVELRVHTKSDPIIKTLQGYQKRLIPRAQRYALNNVLSKINTRALKTARAEIRAKLTGAGAKRVITNKLLKTRVKLFKAPLKKPRANIYIYLLPFNVYKLFGEQGTRFKTDRPLAFVATMPTGHTGIYYRKPNSKHKISPATGQWTELPIKEFTLEVHQPLKDAYTHEVNHFALKEYEIVFRRELERLLNLEANKLNNLLKIPGF